MSTRPRTLSPIRLTRCSRWSPASRTIRNSCRSARISRSSAARSETARSVLVATMTVGYGMIRESFTTRVHLDRAAPRHPRRISRRAVHFPGEPLALPADRRGHQRSRVLHRLCLPLAPVRAAGRRPVRPGRRALYERVRGPRRQGLRTEGRGARVTAMSAAASGPARTLWRLISPRPRSPNRSLSCTIGSSRLPAAKCTSPDRLVVGSAVRPGNSGDRRRREWPANG